MKLTEGSYCISGMMTNALGSPGLPASQAHVHLLRLEEETGAETLSGEELWRASQFLDEEARTRFVAARTVLRRLLGRTLSLAPGEVPLRTGQGGKPQLCPPHNWLHFNVSHAGQHGLFGFAAGRAIGVDLERVQQRPGLLETARLHFHPAESAALGALPGEARLEAFYRLWTRREAVLKALGAGLSAPVTDLEVSLHPQPASWLVSARGSSPGDWLTQSLDCGLDLGPGWQAAVAVQGGAPMSTSGP